MRHVILAAIALAVFPAASLAHGGGGHGGHVRIIAVPTYTQRVIIIHFARCEALNVQVTMPNDWWKRVDPKAIGSRTSFLLVRHHPELTISLAGERVGVEANDTNQTVLAASQAKMKTLAGAEILPGQYQLFGQNIRGISYFANAEQDGTQAHYAMWVASRNGYNYKLAVFGEQKYQPAIDAVMRNFVHNMRQIDPRRVAHAESKVHVAYRYLDDAEQAAPKEPEPFAEPLVK